MQNAQFGSKIKILKNMLKATLTSHSSCFVQKRLKKTPNIPKMTCFCHNTWAIAFAQCSVWVKNLNSKRDVKIDKIGHNAWAIAFAKCSFSVKN